VTGGTSASEGSAYDMLTMTNKQIPLRDHFGLNGREREALEEIVQDHQGLDDVFRWGRQQVPPVVPEDVVMQDEFSHDVIVPWARGLYLVYDTT
jgi:hypothetical protein